MSEDSFETLCAIRETLIWLGMGDLLAKLGEDETAAEAVMEELCESEA